jgi:hypothetical protein
MNIAMNVSPPAYSLDHYRANGPQAAWRKTEGVKFGNLSPSQTLVKNAATHMKNAFRYLIQDHGNIKADIIVYSSLLLVTTRSVVTNMIAAKAVGTPKEDYRRTQAIRTTFRQMFGWSASYLMLRKIQGAIQSLLNKAFGVTSRPDTMRAEALAGMSNIKKDFWTWISDPKALKLAEDNHALYLGPRENVLFNDNSRLYNNKVMRWLIDDVFSNPRLLAESERDAFKLIAGRRVHRFISWTSLLVSSVPTVLISGFALEYFNQNYSDKVFKKVSHSLENIVNKMRGHDIASEGPRPLTNASQALAPSLVSFPESAGGLLDIPTPTPLVADGPLMPVFTAPMGRPMAPGFMNPYLPQGPRRAFIAQSQ